MGAAVLLLDVALVWLTLGYWLAPRAAVVAGYLVAGAAAGVVVNLAGRVTGRDRSLRWVDVGGLAAAVLYAPGIIERVDDLGSRIVSAGVLWLVLAAAVVGYVVLIGVLGMLAAGAARWTAPVLAAMVAAVGLAVNRNVIDEPLTASALLADGAIVAAAAAVAFATRGSRRRPSPLLIGVGGVVIAIGAVLAATDHDPVRAPAGPPPAGDPPNLVLVIVDTCRQDVFEDVVRNSPEGRRFAAAVAGSAWFDNAVAAAPWTAPSVASVLTGLYPPEHGFEGAGQGDPNRPLKRLPKGIETLAQGLGRSGYMTAAITTNVLLHPVTGISRGFSFYELMFSAVSKLPLATALADLGLLRDEAYQDAGTVRRRLAQALPAWAADGRPLFLWLHLMDPHYPLQAHRDLVPSDMNAAPGAEEALYRDEVRYALRELGSMIDLLRSEGLWDDTVFVLVADHGEMFPSDGREGKVPVPPPGWRLPRYRHGHALYRELTRVPLVVRPRGGLDHDRQVHGLASHVDLHDTIIDLLGVPLARVGRDRVSLAPWAGPDGPSGAGRAFALSSGTQFGPPKRAIRTVRHKLILTPSTGAMELYDLRDDPLETVDRASSEPGIADELRSRLEEMWAGMAPRGEAARIELDDEARRQLQELGYIE